MKMKNYSSCWTEHLLTKTSLSVFTTTSVFSQVTFCWASTVLIWPSWTTTRQFLCWRLRQLSPRWCSVSSRPSPRIQRRTQRPPTMTNWNLWTTHVTTPSTGRRCGLAGWDYRGRAAFITANYLNSSILLFLCERLNLDAATLVDPCRFSHMHWCRDIVLQKTNNESWGFSIVGGYEESHGQQPFFIKTIVPGTPAHFDGRLK